MDRNVPRTTSEEIELYIRTYYSLLRSSEDVQIRSLVEAHAQMESLLHPGAREPVPDMSAFIYSLLRLPECLASARLVLLGQSREVFERNGLALDKGWARVASRARRRRALFDGQETLAVFIASHSDIDDLIPMLTAYQIEWNKLNQRLRRVELPASGDRVDLAWLAGVLGLSPDDADRLQRVWGAALLPNLRAIQAAPKRFAVRLLTSSLTDYRRATLAWYDHVEASAAGQVDLRRRPVYFVSSNTHSLINLLSGFALRHRDELLAYVRQGTQPGLEAEWRDIEARHVPSNAENFLYYVLKKYAHAPEGQAIAAARAADEAACGLLRIESDPDVFEVDTQLVELCRLRPDWLDPRLQMPGTQALALSEAVIVNIDYPLGMAAYLIVTQLAARVAALRGLYVMGKAATLNGVVGDVMIPTVVYDEQSHNTYLFDNCFRAGDLAPHLTYGTALDNQKAVTVRGTFLQNANYAHIFYKENYTSIEMEAGPFLSAAFELARPKRYPSDEIVNLYHAPFDLGLLHYASDTPLSKGRNLGAGNLSYFGMDPTYAASLAILRRIFALEIARVEDARVSDAVVESL
ncbi:MAG: hypothetical protein IT318_27605 [Anaerolineales bacterium]|nr:hypothetical protein [Anaerolineales bacterium]